MVSLYVCVQSFQTLPVVDLCGQTVRWEWSWNGPGAAKPGFTGFRFKYWEKQELRCIIIRVQFGILFGEQKDFANGRKQIIFTNSEVISSSSTTGLFSLKLLSSHNSKRHHVTWCVIRECASYVYSMCTVLHHAIEWWKDMKRNHQPLRRCSSASSSKSSFSSLYFKYLWSWN